MADKSKQTVIEEGTEFEGIVVSECGITLSGKLKGDVTAPTLTVNATGCVDGSVRVEKLVSHGEVSGEIDADQVQLSGKVSDRTVLRAKSLEVKLAQPGGPLQMTFGNCELKVGDKLDKRKHEPARVVGDVSQPETAAVAIDRPAKKL